MDSRQITIQYIKKDGFEEKFWKTYDIQLAFDVWDALQTCFRFPPHVEDGADVDFAFFHIGGEIITEKHVEGGRCMFSLCRPATN